MMAKSFKQIIVCIIAAIMAIALACGIAFGAVIPVLAQDEAAPSVFTGYSEGLTEKQLYEETNTFSYNGNPYDSGSNVEEFRKYNNYYNMNVKQTNNVVSDSAPQITVITHGLGGSASHWSNNSLNIEWNKGVLFNFAYSEDSIMSRIESELLGEGNVNLYWAKMASHNSFYLVDLKDPDNINSDGTYRSPEDTKYDPSATDAKTINQLSDVSKHIIIVFEASSPVEYNNIVYEELNYVLSKIIYDVKVLSGNQLPRLNLIGHSRGGITNLQYVLDHPDLVAGLYSMGTPYFGTNTGSTDLGAKVVGGMSHGLEDIIDRNIYVNYYDRWHLGYESLYKNIDTYALGGYSDSDLVFDALINDKFGVVSEETSTETLQIAKWAVKSLGELVNSASSTARYIDLFASFFRDVDYDESEFESYVQIIADITYWDNEYADLGDKFLHVIPFAGCPYFMNDLLVNLSSQIGEDEHSDTWHSYGFNTYVKMFTNDDYLANGKIRISSPMPAVVHNLEAQDSDLISKIIEVLDVGSLQAKYMYQKLDNGTISITGMIGDMSEDFELSIPEIIDGYKVTEISPNAFSTLLDRYDIKTVTIPESVKEIGNGAFSGCTMLEKVNMSNSGNLIKIGDNCFSGCVNLNSINLSQTLQEVGIGAFYKCVNLLSIELGANVNYIGVGAFCNCDNLDEIIVSANNQYYSAENGMLMSKDKTTLLSYSSENDTSIQLVFPDTLITINQYAFYDNESLLSVDLANVTNIREGAFADCVNLATILSDKVNIIEGFAFEGTKWLENNANFAVVGNALYKCQKTEADLNLSGYFSVSPFALLDNTSVETVTFNNAARTIGAYAFLGCENLNSVYLNNLNNMIYVGTGSFNETSDNLNIYMPQRVLPEYESNELWQQYVEKFTVHSTAIHFVLGGGDVDGQTSYIGNVQYGGYLTLPEPEREGYKFDGWYNSENFSGDQILNDALWTSYDDNVSMYAKWTPITYSIIYDANGGNVDSSVQYYTIEDNVTYITPQRVGYTFEGWYFDEALTKPAGNSFEAGKTGDIRLYASWTPNNYVVTYNYNLNEGESLSVSYPEEASVTFGQTYSLVAPERYGYVFNGWRDSNGKFYSNEDGEANLLSWDFAGDITLYADWTLITYTIKIDDDGIIYYVGPNGNICETEVQIPSNMILNLLGMIENYKEYARNLRVGHKFAYFTDENGDKITSWSNYLSNIKIGETIVLNAYYEVEQNFTIDFIGETTTGVGGPFIGQFESKINYAIASKEGYTFKYWFVADTPYNNDYYDNTALAPGEIFDYTLMPDLSVGKEEDGYHIYLEAYFEPNEYFISLHSEYDTLEQPTVSVLYDSICTLPTPYDFGRVFTGWYTSNGVQITNGNGILLEKWQYLSDMDLYARWELKVYRITYIDGYKHNNPTSITIESPTIILNDAVREGYRFMGWYNTPDFDASYAYRVATLGIKNQVLYARWEKLYTISFNTNGGSSVSSFTGIKGEQFILPTSYKDGYDGSWGNYGFGDSFTVAGSMTLTAVWTGKYYTITFDNNGGSGGTVSAQVQYNGSMPDIDLPTCAGHKLDYFYDSDNNKYYVNANYDERAYTFTRNITLTAHWSEAFLIIENLGKSDGGWKIRITNWSSTLVMVNYNKLMCNFGDAQNWTGLKDISSFQLYPEISAEVVIKGNWFATSVTFSYVAGNYRYITYADGLNADGSINVRYNKISI